MNPRVRHPEVGPGYYQHRIDIDSMRALGSTMIDLAVDYTYNTAAFVGRLSIGLVKATLR